MTPATNTNDGGTGCDLLIRNAHVLTCDAARTCHPHGAVAVQGRDIVAVGTDADLAASFHARRTIDAGGALVHPGFVDAHYHLTFHMVGKMIDEVDFSGADPGPWVAGQYTAMINAIGDEEEHANALLCGLDMLRNGVTAVMDPGTAFEPDAIAKACETLGFRASVADPWVMDINGPQLSDITRARVDRDAAMAALGGQLWRNDDSTSLVSAHVSVYGMGNDSDELCLAARAVAARAGVPFNMHQSQSVDDAESDDERFGRHALLHLRDIGLLGPDCVFVHMNALREDEYEAVAESGMTVVWSPTNAWYYATRARLRSPMPALHRRGTRIAIGLDVSKAASFDDQIYTGYLLARDQGDYLSPQDLLQMYTANGAHALGLADRIGSLEPGKRADIVIRHDDRPEVWPRHNAVRHHLLLAKSRTIDTVLVDGKVRVEGGRLKDADEREIYRLAESAAGVMRRRAGLA